MVAVSHHAHTQAPKGQPWFWTITAHVGTGLFRPLVAQFEITRGLFWSPVKPNPHKHVGRSANSLGRSPMWLNIWAVTIAMAIGFSVLALVIQPKNDRATLGR